MSKVVAVAFDFLYRKNHTMSNDDDDDSNNNDDGSKWKEDKEKKKSLANNISEMRRTELA